MILFSIIALEKFAQTTENKITIQKRLKKNPLYHKNETFKGSDNDVNPISNSEPKSTPKYSGIRQFTLMVIPSNNYKMIFYRELYFTF